MFTPTDVELYRLNAKARLPKPGTQHGQGGKTRGGVKDKWTDKRPSFNKKSPFIRPSRQVPAGQFVALNDADDAVKTMASVNNGNAQSGIAVRRVYKPLRSRLS